jgi:hypothetical protein
LLAQFGAVGIRMCGPRLATVLTEDTLPEVLAKTNKPLGGIFQAMDVDDHVVNC